MIMFDNNNNNDDDSLQQANITAKRHGKLTKYRQLALELRDRRLDYGVTIVTIVISVLVEA